MTDGLTPPHNKEIERLVLGAILRDGKCFYEVELDADWFYLEKHRRLYEGIEKLLSEQKGVDVVTLSSYVQSVPLSEIASIAASVVTSANIKHHAIQLKDLYDRRMLFRGCIDVLSRVSDPEADVGELLSTFHRLNTEVGDKDKQIVKMEDVIREVNEKLELVMRSGVTGISTGYKMLDNMIDGLQPGDLVVLAGRPSMGKSSFAWNIIDNAESDGASCAFFSLEMSSVQVGQRAWARAAGVPLWKIRKGMLSKHDLQKLYNAMQVAEKRIWVVRRVKNESEMYRHIYQLVKTRGVNVVVIDYLQLLGRAASGRVAELGQITRTLKLLCQELDINIILLSQLNRRCEEREDKRPILSDLRDSGDIEQDADVVMFLYRDEYYHEGRNEGLVEVLIRKSRNTETGVVRLRFDKDTQTFVDEDMPFDREVEQGIVEKGGFVHE